MTHCSIRAAEPPGSYPWLAPWKGPPFLPFQAGIISLSSGDTETRPCDLHVPVTRRPITISEANKRRDEA
jgi:hypothetical protein